MFYLGNSSVSSELSNVDRVIAPKDMIHHSNHDAQIKLSVTVHSSGQYDRICAIVLRI